eukprot:CAMPEP_0181380074 /NCGR_PEP_ID=MMETSP1106-20121128/19345_1 /TAXON_ID=81844 /ORGANISM="Mantoniella antarctica, Strain SL-175" /LENGTH=110 /DNA_ID=CAMNT_0023499069 /DNA_START=51 /DNA_END=380 /DNA_ORIENTATION=-
MTPSTLDAPYRCKGKSVSPHRHRWGSFEAAARTNASTRRANAEAAKVLQLAPAPPSAIGTICALKATSVSAAPIAADAATAETSAPRVSAHAATAFNCAPTRHLVLLLDH